MKIFNKERALTPSWDLLGPSIDLLKKHLQPILYLSVLPQLVLTLGLTMLPKNFQVANITDGSPPAGVLIATIGALWALLTYAGFILFAALTAQGKVISTRDAFTQGLQRFFPLIGASLLVGLITFLGFIALVVPGLVFLRRYYLTPYYVVERGYGPLQAMKRSSADSKPVSAWVWGTIGVTAVFALASSMLGAIPILGTIAGVIVSYVYIYGTALRYCEVVRLKTVPLNK